MNDPKAKCDCGNPELRHLGYRKKYGGGWKYLNGYYCLSCGAIYTVKEYVKLDGK